MPTPRRSSERIRAVLDLVRDPELKPDWGLSLLVVVLLAGGVAIASALGDPERVVFTVVPFLVAVVGGLAAGWRAGLALSLFSVGLITVAGLLSYSPVTAALGFAAIAFWFSMPSRWRPSPAVSPILLVIYFIAMALARPSASLWVSLAFASVALGLGILLVLAITALRRRRRPTPGPDPASSADSSTEAVPMSADPSSTSTSGLAWVGPLLAAAIIAGFTYWHSVTPGFQLPLWVLLTFLLVYHPTHPATLRRSLLRLAGTITGFVAMLILGLLPESLARAIGVAAIVPAIAYSKHSYLLSVAAGTILVVTVYGAPSGDYLAWGLARTLDTAIGAAIAITLSALVRRIDPAAEATTSPPTRG